MPTIARFGKTRLVMYPGDHPPPHFHVVSKEYRAKYRISDGELLAGKLPRKEAQFARKYCKQHRAELMAQWAELNEPE